MATVDNSTQIVTSTESGTGWSVDVTACNLDENVALKDFTIRFDEIVQSNADFTKASATLLTYSGAALPSTEVSISRDTPNERVQCVTYGDRLQSSVYEAEFNRVHRLINEGEITNNYLKVSPDDTTPGFLEAKTAAGTNITLSVLNPGANEQLQISAVPAGGSGGNVIGIGLLTTELPAVTSPTPGTKVWVSAIGRDAVNDGGEGLFYWDEADITSTADDGIIYLVQGGAGVGRWKRFRADKTWWDIRWYGVVADASTDNFAALERMRVTIETSYNDQVNTIFIPAAPLSYDYSNNRWLRQLRHIRLDGYGASIRNTDAVSAFAEDRYPIQVNELLVDNGGLQRSVLGAYKTTYKFDPALPGDTLLTFSTPGDGNNFVVGEEIYITGKQRQEGGYPPNMTYFELHRVEAVTANDITLEQPLKYEYRDDWYDSAPQGSTPSHIFGAGSMFKVDTATTITCRTFEARGLRFEDNPNFGGGSKFSLNGLYWGRLIDCVFDDIVYVAQTMDAQIMNTRIKEIEIDKLIETLRIHNCSLGGNGLETLVAATGVRKLHIHDNQVVGRIRVAPIELADIQDNTVSAISAITDAAIRMDTSFATLKFNVKNNTVRSPVLIPGTIVDPIGPLQSLTVDAVSSTDIILTDSALARETAYQRLNTGTVIHNGDASNIGMVTAVYGGNGTDVTIEGTWENAPAVSEVYYWAATQTSILENNTWEDYLNGRADQGSATTEYRSFEGTFYPLQNEATKVITLTSDVWSFDRTNTLTLRCYVTKIEVEVSRIYTGAFGGTVDVQFARFATPTAGISANRQTIDLKTLGKRALSSSPWQTLTAPAGSGDSYNIGELGLYYDRMQIRFREGAADLGSYNFWELAQGVIRIYVTNPRASVTNIPINLSEATT